MHLELLPYIHLVVLIGLFSSSVSLRLLFILILMYIISRNATASREDHRYKKCFNIILYFQRAMKERPKKDRRKKNTESKLMCGLWTCMVGAYVLWKMRRRMNAAAAMNSITTRK